MGLSSQSYIFDPRPNYPLLITAKRYWKSNSPDLHNPSALTLIFAHGTGFHKEQWEPTIDELYALLDGPHGSPKIREVWSIDAPNHGDAAILNEDVLKWGYEPIFPWEEYARAIHTFLTGLGTGVNVDFSTRRLVGVGHSMGAVCLMLSLGYSSKLKFESLILCELMSMHERFAAKAAEMLINGGSNRRDIWPSFEEAYKVLKSRAAWKVWDDRVLRIFVTLVASFDAGWQNQGIRALPTSTYPDKEGVTLKCTRVQETACYRDAMGPSRAYNLLRPMTRRVPVHLIYGAINDYLYVFSLPFRGSKFNQRKYCSPQELKDDIVNNAIGGIQHLASLSRVEGAGHLIIQMNPTGLAQKIYDALTVPQRATAKL
ncbi:hypothetical protein H0H92_011039 [Tricholoma furcatifolium]|nr:hypothetical protein H0H92_011039 [Tricholoma furcatifolium]